MARTLFKNRPTNPPRRIRVAQLRCVLPRHHMGRINRAPMVRAEATPGQC